MSARLPDALSRMLVLAGCAPGIVILLFAEVSRPEATLIGALAAIAFALPKSGPSLEERGDRRYHVGFR